MIASEVIREIQQRSGLSQSELARRAGMPRSVVNTYIKGRREPGSDALGRLATAGGFEMRLEPRKPPVDPHEAGRRLVAVLGLAGALPYRPKPTLTFPGMPR